MLEDTTENKIDKSDNFIVDEKHWINKVFDEMGKKQEHLYNELLEKVRVECFSRNAYEQNKNGEKIFHQFEVVTSLVSEDTRDNLESKLELLKKDNLFEIVKIFPNSETFDIGKHKNIEYAGTAFLDCDYKDVRKYLDSVEQPYKAKISSQTEGDFELDYYFEKNYDFLVAECILTEILIQNAIKYPPIYSPFSRRAVDIKLKLDGRDLPEDAKVDLCYKENNLDQVVKTNTTLVWNVLEDTDLKILDDAEDKNIIPFNDNVFKLCQVFIDKDEYIFVQDERSDIKRVGNNVYVLVDKDNKNIDISYKKIALKKYNISNLDKNYIYKNDYDYKNEFKERILTKGDVAYIVGQFADIGICLDSILTSVCKKSQTIIGNYSSDYKDTYKYSKDDIFRIRSIVDDNVKECDKPTDLDKPIIAIRSTLYIKFKPSGDRYFVDKVNYISSFLNYFYPEFIFVGVV